MRIRRGTPADRPSNFLRTLPCRGRADVSETWLTVGWGAVRRLDLEQASCSDPACEADHGYTGALVGDDLTVRMSAAADGADRVDRLTRFSSALQRAAAV